MVESLKALTGDPICKWQGRLLASRLHPKLEAANWLEARRAQLIPAQTIFVLGAGCGYHLDALVESSAAAIIAIETNPLIVNWLRDNREIETERCRVQLISSATELKTNPDVVKALTKSYIFLEHKPSVANDPKLYSEIARVLRARDWSSLTWMWSRLQLPDLNDTPKIRDDGRPLTIIDVFTSPFVTEMRSNEAMLFHALRELVK